MYFQHASAGKSTLLMHTISMQANDHSPVFLSSAHTRGLWLGKKNNQSTMRCNLQKYVRDSGFSRLIFTSSFITRKIIKMSFFEDQAGRPAVSVMHSPPLSLKRRVMISNTSYQKPYSPELHWRGHFNFIYYFHTLELPNRQTTQRWSSRLYLSY